MSYGNYAYPIQQSYWTVNYGVVMPRFAASREAYEAYTAQHLHTLQQPLSMVDQNVYAATNGAQYAPSDLNGNPVDPTGRSQSAASSGPSQYAYQQNVSYRYAGSQGHSMPPDAYAAMMAQGRQSGDHGQVVGQAQPQQPHNVQGEVASGASNDGEDDSDEPFVLPALGWWPDKPAPTLHWNLTSTTPPLYIKRSFNPEEFSESPFSPPLQRMRLILDEECGWVFEIRSPALSSAEFARNSNINGGGGPDVGVGGGEKFITLRSFFTDLGMLMHSHRVPWTYWRSATAAKRYRAACALERRTGRPIPTSAIVLPSVAGVSERAENADLDAYVAEGAPSPASEWTALLVSDLLGPEDVMFWGLALSRAPDEWMLRTAPCHS